VAQLFSLGGKLSRMNKNTHSPEEAAPKKSKTSYYVVLLIAVILHIAFLANGYFQDRVAAPPSIILAAIEVICIYRLFESNPKNKMKGTK